MTSAQAQTSGGLPTTAAKLALAQQVVETVKLPRTMTFTMNVMLRPFIQQIKASEGPPEFKAYVVDLMQSELASLEQKTLPLLAGVYASTFTEEQLADILAFYRTPTGQLLIEKQPELARAGQLVVMPLIPPMQHDLIDKMFDHLCSTQKCTPDQRSKMEVLKAQVLQKLTAQQNQAPVEMPAQ